LRNIQDRQVEAASPFDPRQVGAAAIEEAYELLETSPQGLSDTEASARLSRYGPNTIKETRKSPLWLKFVSQLTSLFAILLWMAAGLSFVSNQRPLGFAIIFVILINAIFAFFMEYRAEKAIEALKKLLPQTAQVIRGGEIKEIQAEDLVPGDVLVIKEGDHISADSRLIQANDLRVNNSALTGEAERVAAWFTRRACEPSSAR
jgi:magnesium-transporting ATPase (P-type)